MQRSFHNPGSSAQLRQLAGHIPSSVQTIRVVWDLISPKSGDDISQRAYQDKQQEARDAALECLRAYKDQNGFPIRRWEYEVIPGAGPPPTFIIDTEETPHTGGAIGPGTATRDTLVLEYAVVEKDTYGKFRDTPWKSLTECVVLLHLPVPNLSTL